MALRANEGELVGCGWCRFFQPIIEPSSGNPESGECRIAPPRLTDETYEDTGNRVPFGRFPEVLEDCWCGQFRHQETGVGLQ